MPPKFALRCFIRIAVIGFFDCFDAEREQAPSPQGIELTVYATKE
ncbi:hypothetical protein EMIT0P100_40013 [Pseudomonas sp. IT-P100]